MSTNNDCIPFSHIRDSIEVSEGHFSTQQPLDWEADTLSSEEIQRNKLPVLEPRVQTDSLHYWRAGLDKKLANSYLASVEKGVQPYHSSNPYDGEQNPPAAHNCSYMKQSTFFSSSSTLPTKPTTDFSKQDASSSVNSAASFERVRPTTASSHSSSDNEPGEERVADYYKGPVFMALSRNTDNRRHICEVCQKRFSRPSSLKTHMYTHTGEKPFICVHEGCNKRFSVESNLRRHLRLHGTLIAENNPLEEL